MKKDKIKQKLEAPLPWASSSYSLGLSEPYQIHTKTETSEEVLDSNFCFFTNNSTKKYVEGRSSSL